MFNIDFANDWIQTVDIWYLEATAMPSETQPLPTVSIQSSAILFSLTEKTKVKNKKSRMAFYLLKNSCIPKVNFKITFLTKFFCGRNFWQLPFGLHLIISSEPYRRQNRNDARFKAIVLLGKKWVNILQICTMLQQPLNLLLQTLSRKKIN